MADKKAALQGRVVRGAQPLVGVERDEIADMVSRIKQADARARQPVVQGPYAPVAPVVKNEDLQWASEWQLPKEMFDYFIVERG
jgi:hypothetical protein